MKKPVERVMIHLQLFMLIVIATFFFLISLASQVSAETAWVKWEHETHQEKNSAKVTSDKWYLQEAFPDYEACMSAIRATAKCDAAFSIFENCRTGSEYIRFGNHEEFITLQFHCYPDTIDPRK